MSMSKTIFYLCSIVKLGAYNDLNPSFHFFVNFVPLCEIDFIKPLVIFCFLFHLLMRLFGSYRGLFLTVH